MQKSLGTLCLIVLTLLLAAPSRCQAGDPTSGGLQTFLPEDLTSPATESAIEVLASCADTAVDVSDVSPDTEATGTPPACEDKMESCSALGYTICTAYELWPRIYCARSCDLCNAPPVEGTVPSSNFPDLPSPRSSIAGETEATTTATGSPVTEISTTVPQIPNCCVDKAGWRTCITHHRESCETIYIPWATDNCPGFCGFCQPCPLEPCVDEIPFCEQYGEGACTDENYAIWAYNNCRKTCRLCYKYGFYYEKNPNVTIPTLPPEKPENSVPTNSAVTGPTTGGEVCVDRVARCEVFGKEDCGIYQDFMAAYCPKFCGFCSFKPDVTGGEVEATAATVEPEVCEDKLNNCTHYLPESCCGIYEPWARAHCASYCGFCGVPPPRICKDTISYCDREPEDLCTNPNYRLFRIEHCAGFCKLCETPWLPPPCAQHLYTAVEPEVCEDKLNNCTHYLPESCCGIYEPWARAHCASYCGFCGVPPPRICKDTISYCDREPEDLCTNPNYRLFRIEHCAGFCKLCETPWLPPPCAQHLYTEKTTEDTADLWTTGSSLTPIPV